MTTPDHDPPPRPRNGRGQWIRTAAGRERDTTALDMRSRGRTWREIAETLGYTDAANARRGVANALAEVHYPAVNEMRAEMAERLDQLHREAMAVLEARHIKIHEGRPVYIGPEGAETLVEDDAPVLRAAETILKIEQRRAALFGLDAPTRTKVDVEIVDFTIDGVPTEEV